jgi:hypothetical protein
LWSPGPPVLAFLYRPSRETLLGFLFLAAILMLYLPIVGKVWFSRDGDRYE